MREHGLWARSTHLAWLQGAKHSLQALWYGSKSACLASSRTGVIRREGGREGRREREKEKERESGRGRERERHGSGSIIETFPSGWTYAGLCTYALYRE